MRIQFPQQTLARPLHMVKALTVIRHNRECYIVTSNLDPADTDFSTGEQDAHPDIMCLNIQTGALEPIGSRIEVELMESELTVVSTGVLPMQNEPKNEYLPLTQDEIRALQNHKKIEAIRLIRQRTHLGLKDAKDIADAETLRLGF